MNVYSLQQEEFLFLLTTASGSQHELACAACAACVVRFEKQHNAFFIGTSLGPAVAVSTLVYFSKEIKDAGGEPAVIGCSLVDVEFKHSVRNK